MKPLNKWKRRSLLFTLVIIFLILGPWIILNSFGYRVDNAFDLVKTGGLYIHSDTTGLDLFINGKYIKNNNALARNLFVQKLKPNTRYKVEVHKEDFHSWVKEIYVYPSIVSEGRIFMLPIEIEKEEVFPFFNEEGEGVNSPIPGFTKVSRTTTGKIIPENKNYIDIVTLFEGENPYEEKVPEVVESKSILDKEEVLELPKHYIELGIEDPEKLDNLIETSDEISWLKDGNIVLYWIDKIDSIPYYYCGGEKERICNNQIILDWSEPIKKFEYFGRRNDVWVVLVNDGIYAVEVDPRSQRNIQPIYLGSNLDFEISGSGKIFVKEKGSYFELDL